MKSTVRSVVMGVILVALVSCAGRVYVSRWVYTNTKTELNDTLFVSGGAFKLERSSPDGVSTFSGRLTVQGDEWAFDVDMWTPSNAVAERCNPPIRYVYNVKEFQNGIAFYSYRVVSASPINIFIKAPSQFEIRE